MADLILGTENHLALSCDLEHGHYETLFADAKHLAEIVDRIRAQTLHITRSLRQWTARHGELRHPLKRKYSAYEGMLCRQDLKQHLILYRHAVREYHKAKRLCDQNAPKRRSDSSRKLGKSRAA